MSNERTDRLTQESLNWLELSVQATAEYVEPLSELFRRYGDSSVVVQLEGDWDPDNDPGERSPPTKITVTTYLKMDATIHSRREMIDIGVRLISYLQPLGQLQQRVIEQRDWEAAWKAHFTLLRVGKRIVLKPTWQGYTPRPEDVVVELDPGMAFGTGHHPTTRMCLEELERFVTTGAMVLDIGVGSGILSIAAAKLGASRVVGLDTDDLAVQASIRNARQNNTAEALSVYHGSLPHAAIPKGRFDVVVANITARAVAALAEQMEEALAPEGVLIASGIIAERQAEAEEALKRVMSIEKRRYDGDWVLLIVRKKRQ